MPRKGEPQAKLDKNRREIFLAALESSGGNFSHACNTASPHSRAVCRTPKCYSSWRALMARDPAFAAEVAEVLTRVKDRVFGEIYRRAMEGTLEPVFQKGMRASNGVDEDGNPIPASITRHDNRLLLRLAARLDPENWSETKNIRHDVVHSGAAVMLKPPDLASLSADQTAHLKDILTTIQSSRGDGQKALTHQPAEILDADYEEVEVEVEGAELAEAFPY